MNAPTWSKPAIVTGDLVRYRASIKLEQSVHGVSVGYRLTLDRVPSITVTPYHRDPSLPKYSVRVSIGEDELVLTVEDWDGQSDEMAAHLLAWILERADLRGARMRRGARRPNPLWVAAWHVANPGGRR